MRKLSLLFLLQSVCFGSGIYNPGSTGAGGSGGYALQPATVTIVAAQGITLPDNTTVSTGAINLSQLANVASANALINGNFQFWQRSLASASPVAGTYVVDRWEMDPQGSFSGAWAVARVSTVTVNALYALQWKTNGTPNPGVESIVQQVENYYDFLGSSVTFTIWVNSTIATTVGIRDSIGTSTSAAHPADSAWHQLTVTRFISTSATSLRVVLANNTLNGTNNTVYYDGAMLVVGDTPINYVPRPYAEELAMCQRYYEKSYALDTVPGSNTGTNLQISIGALIGVNTVSFHYISFKVPMRIAPGSISIWDQSGTSGKWSTVGTTGSGHSTSITGTQIGTNGFNGNENSNADTYAEGHWSADAEIP